MTLNVDEDDGLAPLPPLNPQTRQPATERPGFLEPEPVQVQPQVDDRMDVDGGRRRRRSRKHRKSRRKSRKSRRHRRR